MNSLLSMSALGSTCPTWVMTCGPTCAGSKPFSPMSRAPQSAMARLRSLYPRPPGLSCSPRRRNSCSSATAMPRQVDAPAATDCRRKTSGRTSPKRRGCSTRSASGRARRSASSPATATHPTIACVGGEDTSLHMRFNAVDWQVRQRHGRQLAPSRTRSVRSSSPEFCRRYPAATHGRGLIHRRYAGHEPGLERLTPLSERQEPRHDRFIAFFTPARFQPFCPGRRTPGAALSPIGATRTPLADMPADAGVIRSRSTCWKRWAQTREGAARYASGSASRRMEYCASRPARPPRAIPAVGRAHRRARRSARLPQHAPGQWAGPATASWWDPISC